jgi:hypothetical protein
MVHFLSCLVLLRISGVRSKQGFFEKMGKHSDNKTLHNNDQGSAAEGIKGAWSVQYSANRPFFFHFNDTKSYY